MNHRRLQFPVQLICVAFLAAFGSVNATGQSLVKNGDFEDWQDDKPADWQVEIGANNGGQKPVSELRRIAGPALMLRGDSTTMAWRSVSQDLSLQPQQSYTMSWEALAEGVKREGRQYDNCYVGVMHFDAAGKRLDMTIEDLSRVTEWKRQEIKISPPAATAKSKLIIFLSKSGSLKVKDISLE
jgi:hypothetical protein